MRKLTKILLGTTLVTSAIASSCRLSNSGPYVVVWNHGDTTNITYRMPDAVNKEDTVSVSLDMHGDDVDYIGSHKLNDKYLTIGKVASYGGIMQDKPVDPGDEPLLHKKADLLQKIKQNHSSDSYYDNYDRELYNSLVLIGQAIDNIAQKTANNPSFDHSGTEYHSGGTIQSPPKPTTID